MKATRARVLRLRHCRDMANLRSGRTKADFYKFRYEGKTGEKSTVIPGETSLNFFAEERVCALHIPNSVATCHSGFRPPLDLDPPVHIRQRIWTPLRRFGPPTKHSFFLIYSNCKLLGDVL